MSLFGKEKKANEWAATLLKSAQMYLKCDVDNGKKKYKDNQIPFSREEAKAYAGGFSVAMVEAGVDQKIIMDTMEIGVPLLYTLITTK